MAELPGEIARINALTNNARNTWFVLLGVLVFVGITLMGVEHIDFYGVDRATTLPLVNFDVPTRYFFLAAPILVAAIYGYFHLYLIRLWDALGNADATIDGKPLGDLISPWLITDAALYLRVRLRDDMAATHRLLEGSAMALNFLIAWAFGLVVLFFLWWLSMPARTFWMTAIAGLSLLAASFVGAASLALMISRMRRKHTGPQRNVFRTLPAMWLLVLALPALIGVSYLRTTGDVPYLATISMVDEAVVERPAGWLPYGVAKAEYKDAWCRRKSADCAMLSEASLAEFETDWTARRDATRADMRRPYWSDRSNENLMNWQGANLNSAYLVGAYLYRANLEGADLNSAQLEGANLTNARLQGASLVSARLEHAKLQRADIQGVNFSGAALNEALLGGAELMKADFFTARMNGASLNRAYAQGAKFDHAVLTGADLFGAELERASFFGAQLQGANFNQAKMKRVILVDSHLHGASFTSAVMPQAILRRALMEKTNLFSAKLDGADLRGAIMQDVILNGTKLHGANIGFAGIFGSDFLETTLSVTNLAATQASGTALRYVDLTQAEWDEKTDFRNAFLDASVTVSDDFRARMGNPCQWLSERLGYREFHSVWRWWIDMLSAPTVTLSYDILSAPYPTPERLAELGLSNCAPDQPFGPMPVAE